MAIFSVTYFLNDPYLQVKWKEGMSQSSITKFLKTTSGLSEKLRNDVEQPEVTSQTSTSTTFSLGITEEKPFHPQTEYVFPKSRSGDKLQSCQAHWFIKFPWLHYDEK